MGRRLRRRSARGQRHVVLRLALSLGTVAAVVAVPAGPALAAYQNTVLATPDLVSYWRMGEESGTTTADVKGLNPGSYRNGPLLGQPGALNGNTDRSVTLDGADDFVHVPDSASVDLGNVFTLEAWVKRGRIGGEQVIMAKQSGGYFFWFAYDYLALNKAVQTGPSAVVRATVPLTDTTRWHHVVATKSGGTAKLYIDGVDRSGPVTDVPLADTASPLTIGDACAGCGGAFKGGLDEVAVYRRAISAAEVQKHYLAGIDGLAPNTTITSAPATTTDSTTATFAFTSSEAGSTFQCRLDAGVYASCASPKTYAGVAVASHTFSVRAVDRAGNVDPSPASLLWTVTAPCRPAFGELRVDNWPPGCWRPYADNSPFNQLIPPNPRLDPDSARIVATVNTLRAVDSRKGPRDFVAGLADTVHDVLHPTFYPQPTDPLYTIHCTEAAWGECEIEGMQVRIPSAARPAAGVDGSMTVVDQANFWEYDFWQVQSKPAGGGVIAITWGGRTRIGTADSDGLGNKPGDTGANAASVGLLAGIIRAQEMEVGEIRHALYMVVACDAGSDTGVYPAPWTAEATPCAPDLRPTAPRMGHRFQLSMTDQEINALAVPPWKKTILRAMARYGMYVADTDAQSRWWIEIESGTTYTSLGREDRFVKFGRDRRAEGGITFWNGVGDSSYNNENYIFDLLTGVPWDRLRVIDACVTQKTC